MSAPTDPPAGAPAPPSAAPAAPDWPDVRRRFIGLDEHTLRKSYYPELQRRLRELERFRALLNQSRDGMLLLTPADARVVDLNDSACAQLGLDRAAATGRSLRELLPGPALAAALDRLAAPGRAEEAELVPATLPGSAAARAEVSLSRSVFETETFLIAVVRDVSERERLEADLARARRVESVGLLAGGIAHDFNNILTAIVANLSLARATRERDPAAWGELLAEIEEAAMRARDLTQQLLAFSKGGAPVRESASAPELLLQSVGFALRGSNVRARFDVPDDLPPIACDPSQLSQVFDNLTMNAREAMATGGALHVSARVAEDRGERWLRISFEDEGPGLAPEQLEHLFEPYYTTKAHGHGLGLATSYAIVKRHGGHMTATAHARRGGAGFTLDIPLAETAPTPPAPLPVAAEGRGGRVLAVDDDPAIRRLLARLMETLGHTAEVVGDGAEALTAWKRAAAAGTPFDLLLTDLTIPGGMGGVELVRALRAIAPDLRAIASSGYSDDPVMADAKAWGFDATLSKPYRLADMGRVLREVLAGGAGRA